MINSRTYRLFLLFILITFSFGASMDAQTSIWQYKGQTTTSPGDRTKAVAEKYATWQMDFDQLKATLAKAPQEKNTPRNQGLVVKFPTPEGTTADFYVYESPMILEPLASKMSWLKTYVAISVEHPSTSARIAVLRDNINGVISTLEGVYYFEASTADNRDMVLYNVKDAKSDPNMAQVIASCGLTHAEQERLTPVGTKDGEKIKPRVLEQKINRQEYVAAVAANYEFYVFAGSTVDATVTMIVTTINKVNAILEKEVAVHLNLHGEIDKLVITDPNLKTFNNGYGLQMLPNVGGYISAKIPLSSYDIGHIFGTNGIDVGGVANPSVVCTSAKSNGVSFRYTWQGTDYNFVNTVAHEMGHQYSLSHTFGTCGDNSQLSGTGYEPGSGSTIMSYAGGCGDNNVAGQNSPYYHVNSLEQFLQFTRIDNGNLCPDIIETGNHIPSVSIPLTDSFSIPVSTPFEMTAVGADEDGDELTYCWEQFDLGQTPTPIGQPEGTAPIFRSFDPVKTPTRVFPKIEKIASNNYDNTEVLPTYTRKMHFRATVRDNFAQGGGAAWKEVFFFADQVAGPFAVTSQNTTGISYETGQNVLVTWDVANTDQYPINCKHVDIFLSTNGGQTFPDTLATNLLNNGQAYITIPSKTTVLGRIKIKAADNIFFNLNSKNFRIVAPTKPGVTMDFSPRDPQICKPSKAEIKISTTALLGYDKPVTFGLIDGLPAGATYSFNPASVNPGESTTLTVNTENASGRGYYNINVYGSTESADTVFRKIGLVLVVNDFQTLKLQTPVDGANDQNTLFPFYWIATPDASTYTLEIATNPRFGNTIIYRKEGITDANFTPDETLPENSLLYWRIVPNNECGPGTASIPFAFRTKALKCESAANNTYVNIPSTGTPVKTSVIKHDQAGIVSGVKVLNIKGNHEYFRDIRGSLISPSGTIIKLWEHQCGGVNVNFNFGFDDQSPKSFQCLPNNGLTYKPLEELSGFYGEQAQGDWTFQIADDYGSSGGGLNSWTLTLCTNASVINPLLIKNDLLKCKPSGEAKLSYFHLVAEDNVSPHWELLFTLVTVPQHGRLLLNGQQLNVGDEFSQMDLDNLGRLVYINDDPASADDEFLFTIHNLQNGWGGTYTFNINMDINVSVNEALADKFKIYPNPVSDLLYISGPAGKNKITTAEIYSIEGKLLKSYTLTTGGTNGISTRDMNDGLYFVKLVLDGQSLIKKFVIQH